MRRGIRRRTDRAGFSSRKRGRNNIYAHPDERAKEIEINNELKDYISENRPEKM